MSDADQKRREASTIAALRYLYGTEADRAELHPLIWPGEVYDAKRYHATPQVAESNALVRLLRKRGRR